MHEPPESILSHGERDVAGYLRDGADVAEIAAARGSSEESVEKSIDRIREKTRRAFATLQESPFLEEAARDLDGGTRSTLLGALRDESE